MRLSQRSREVTDASSGNMQFQPVDMRSQSPGLPGGRVGVPGDGADTVRRTGDGGDIQAGATLSYTDNGDGTITDNNTGLRWEKKSADGSIHDKDITLYVGECLRDARRGPEHGNFAGHND